MAINALTSGLGLQSPIPDPRLPNPDSRIPATELREAFHDFVGQSFFRQVLSQMRKTVEKPAYFHGGMGEDLFQGQLDEVLVEHLSDATGETFSQPMYELFMLPRP
jgi:flagellar protein FlgJ